MTERNVTHVLRSCPALGVGEAHRSACAMVEETLVQAAIAEQSPLCSFSVCRTNEV